MKKLSLINQAP